jgi:dTDP-4-amino-4,6-dideoxygalactose transaminase
VDHDEFFMIDSSQIEAKITPKTKAIMPVHLYGHMADMDAILAIAKKHKLLVVEDASQAHGALYKGKRAGSMGDVGCFSLYPGKNLGAYGDAGAIVTNDQELCTKISWWRSWGAEKKYHHELKGGNSRLDTIQAVVLDVKLKYMDEWNAQRCKTADYYSAKLQGVGDLVTPKTPPETSPVWHQYVVRTGRRDALLKFLNDGGIGAGIHYPIPIHELGAYKEEMACYAGKLPATSENAAKLLSLPMFPELTQAQCDVVIEKCKAFFSSQ